MTAAQITSDCQEVNQVLFNVIQTVWHNDGRAPNRYLYGQHKTIRRALVACQTLNERVNDRNRLKGSIPISYHVEVRSF